MNLTDIMLFGNAINGGGVTGKPSYIALKKGAEILDEGEGYRYYKVSDYAPTLEELQSCIRCVIDGSNVGCEFLGEVAVEDERGWYITDFQNATLVVGSPECADEWHDFGSGTFLETGVPAYFDALLSQDGNGWYFFFL